MVELKIIKIKVNDKYDGYSIEIMLLNPAEADMSENIGWRYLIGGHLSSSGYRLNFCSSGIKNKIKQKKKGFIYLSLVRYPPELKKIKRKDRMFNYSSVKKGVFDV